MAVRLAFEVRNIFIELEDENQYCFCSFLSMQSYIKPMRWKVVWKGTNSSYYIIVNIQYHKMI